MNFHCWTHPQDQLPEQETGHYQYPRNSSYDPFQSLCSLTPKINTILMSNAIIHFISFGNLYSHQNCSFMPSYTECL